MDIDVVEIQHNLGCIIAKLGLIHNDTASVSTDRLQRLSDYLIISSRLKRPYGTKSGIKAVIIMLHSFTGRFHHI